MPQEQPKSLDGADQFERWLLEAPEPDLQECIDTSLQSFSTPSLSIELLRECKARIDARLAAEPDKKVFCMSDPHEVRLNYWRTIAERLEAEINFRCARLAQNATKRLVKNPVRPGAGKEPAVAARRTVVRQNPGLPGKELCELLDHKGIHLPKRWPEAGFKTWVEAWRERQRQIQVIFSKDRNSSSVS